MIDIPTLRTERLILAPPFEADLDAYAEMYSDPDVMRHIGRGATLGLGESWRQIATNLGHRHLRGYGFWTVRDARDEAFIGRAGLRYPACWPDVEVGWMMHPRHWGQGYATEAARAVLNHGIATLGIKRIVSLIWPENVASIRVAEKIGHVLVEEIEIQGGPALIYASTR
jgi:RimJ/RimL family protein N-acetyltransferase